MRLVERKEEMIAGIRRARSEALSAFGDDSVYIEKYIESPHHIEFQILADRQGNTLHLFERECSTFRVFRFCPGKCFFQPIGIPFFQVLSDSLQLPDQVIQHAQGIIPVCQGCGTEIFPLVQLIDRPGDLAECIVGQFLTIMPAALPGDRIEISCGGKFRQQFISSQQTVHFDRVADEYFCS